MPILGAITIALFKKAAVEVAVTAAAVPLPVPEDLPKCATPGCYDTYGGLHPCGSPECAEYTSTCTCRNGEASRTEAVEPAGADEEVDEIGRPLRPVPMARGAAPPAVCACSAVFVHCVMDSRSDWRAML